MNSREHDEHHHPKAELLVYGFAGVALTFSSFVALFLHFCFQTYGLSVGGFAIGLVTFFRIAGGQKGINRAIGDGTLSLSVPTVGTKNNNNNKPSVRLCVISDTHNFQIPLPPGDILIHCGDFSMAGTHLELERFCDYLEAQPFAHKIVVCGNHDFGMENADNNPVRDRLFRIATVLENSGVKVMGLTFWGSPHTPNIPRRKPMAFQDSSQALDQAYWQQIPTSGLDVLITHGPPQGFGDRILLGFHVGCPLLRRCVTRNPPRFHLFGHIHEGYGTSANENTVFVNAAICNTLYQPIHPPIVIDVVPQQ